MWFSSGTGQSIRRFRPTNVSRCTQFALPRTSSVKSASEHRASVLEFGHAALPVNATSWGRTRRLVDRPIVKYYFFLTNEGRFGWNFSS
ncbi:hypothetical protein ZOSMA_21G01190 [Zostera marina]|uniref:Uncharacterized protein n=1 Tax=Zostera marina TaxID=29655 RepID=A0A0K9PM07_ZOSMR|nr:hypothetical protein ZOSMA_21G01190 [Zostera marina]